MKIALLIYAIVAVIGMILFRYEIKHAKEIDPKEPFLYGEIN